MWLQNVANPYTLTALITTVKSLIKCALWSLLINWQAYCIFAFSDSHAERLLCNLGIFFKLFFFHKRCLADLRVFEESHSLNRCILRARLM